MLLEVRRRISLEMNTKWSPTTFFFFLNHYPSSRLWFSVSLAAAATVWQRKTETLLLSEAAAGSSFDDGLFTHSFFPFPPSSSCWRKSHASQGQESFKHTSGVWDSGARQTNSPLAFFFFFFFYHLSRGIGGFCGSFRTDNSNVVYRITRRGPRPSQKRQRGSLFAAFCALLTNKAFGGDALLLYHRYHENIRSHEAINLLHNFTHTHAHRVVLLDFLSLSRH